ncbi:hypothetical protein BDW42DRAFT_172945 [Aspergillus taichungensis]|uniref:Uncharacterized protein n=1 Tax=Aspergillus taichungensis TaxID=482145 RepID=A0A2J5HQB5_9EURO|nr:hypothetical protein BDW42DRAFT_172945 [Aspergillus taichungensis]
MRHSPRSLQTESEASSRLTGPAFASTAAPQPVGKGKRKRKQNKLFLSVSCPLKPGSESGTMTPLSLSLPPWCDPARWLPGLDGIGTCRGIAMWIDQRPLASVLAWDYHRVLKNLIVVHEICPLRIGWDVGCRLCLFQPSQPATRILLKELIFSPGPVAITRQFTSDCAERFNAIGRYCHLRARLG